ncbi:LacI family DNA-binding transcriptional regulator [Cellulomonas hominis]
MSEGQARRAVTRDDVARLAGVSTAVVSYALNGGPRPVAEGTREKVLEAVGRLGYRPNTTARALSRGRADMIGMIVSDSRNPYFAELVYAVDVAAQQAGRSLLVINSRVRRAAARDHILALASQQVDGMVVADLLTDEERQMVASLDVPTVLVDQFRRAEDVASIGTDYYTGALAGVGHLVEHGHRTIAFAGGDPLVDQREQGWVDALTAAGLPLGPRYRVGFGPENGYRAGLLLAQEQQRPTALFAASDQVATAAMSALQASGLRVPEDVAVVGFDGTTTARYSWPPLTTMAQPTAAMAQEAIRRLVGGSPETGFTSFRATLQVRRSCGCPFTSGSAG